MSPRRGCTARSRSTMGQPLGAGQQAGPLGEASSRSPRGASAASISPEHPGGNHRGPATSAMPHIRCPCPAPVARDRDEPRAVGHAGPQAHVPGLALVDDVDVPAALVLQQDRLERVDAPQTGGTRPSRCPPRSRRSASWAAARRSRGRAAAADARRCGPGWSPTAAGCPARASDANCAAIWLSSATAWGRARASHRPRSWPGGRAARGARPSGRPGRRTTRPGGGSGTAAGRPAGARRG